MNLGTILGVWAHPDDETYLSAAIMSEAARNGQRVVCVTATRGEQGTWDPERWPTETLGATREQELLRSLEILSPDIEHHFLGYPDGGCADVDHAEAIDRVAKIAEEVEPDSYLCFGQDGGTGHTDHIATCEWTTAAFERVAKPGAKLYYVAQSDEWLEKYFDALQQFNVFMTGRPESRPAAQMDINYVPDAEMAERKLRAIACHESQVEGMIRTFGESFFREAIADERFVLAATKS